MNARMRLFSIGFLIFAFFSAGPIWASDAPPKPIVLFNGEAMDSTEHFSKWIDISGANRIMLRSWSTHAPNTGAGAGDPDSVFSDSISTFKVLFSDSMSFIAVDSLGTTVTARSTIPRTLGVHGEPYPMCVDTVSFTGNFADSNLTMMGGGELPVNKILRGSANADGVISYIYPVLVNSVATVWGDGSVTKRYMRVKVTPLRRHVWPSGAGVVCSGGYCNRVNGLKGFRMTVTVFKQAGSQP